MGRTHAATGLLVGAASVPLMNLSSPAAVLAWTAAWGGAALLPDFDQGGVSWNEGGFLAKPTGSTVVTMWGWVSWAPARLVGKLAGGHRWGTHDPVLAPLAVAVLALAADQYPLTQLPLLAVVTGAALHACAPYIPGRLETTTVGNLALSLTGAWWLTYHAPFTLHWMPLALAGGTLVHIAGDALTRGGVPRPLATLPRAAGGRRARMSADLFVTGDPRFETPIAVACALTTAVLLVRSTGAWQHVHTLAAHLP
ncbi:hypothetical protein GCM10027586_09260 [Kineococcus gypseus]